MLYRVRLDDICGNSTTKLVIQDLFQEADQAVVVHHILPHGNPHYHAFIDIPIKENTLRQRIKRKGFIASNFSLKKCDENRKDEYVQYLFNKKHNNVSTLTYTYNYDSELLDRLQTQAQEYHDEYQANTNAKRTKQFTLYDIADEIEKTVNPQRTVNELGHIDPTSDMLDKYIEVAIKVLRKYRKPFDIFLLRKLIITALSSNPRGVQRIKALVLNYFLNN